MIVLTSAFVLLSAFSCGGGGKATGTNEQSEKVVVNVPQFDADSAYLYVKNQVDFGPRVPNTKEHVACGNYLAGKLEAFGAKVTNQYADLIAYDGTLLKARNIIGSYKPESKKRIALFAHWDTRPWADNDADEKNHHTPILGANDGASGVGALLKSPGWSTSNSRNWALISSFWMRKTTELLNSTRESTRKRLGVSARSIGRAILMCKGIMPVLVSCSIWWVVRTAYF